MMNVKCAIFAFAIILPLCMCDTTESSTHSEINSSNKNIKSDNVTISRQKPLLSTGNELWDGLIQDCLKKPTISCIQKNVYTFLDSTLGLKDVNITNRFQLTQNKVEYKIPEPTPNDEENEIFFEGRGATPIEEVSSALYDKSLKFLVTHDMNFKLPDVVFDGAIFRISPRSIEGNGIVAKLEYIPNPEITAVEARSDDLARLFKKKIKKFFKKKIVLAIIAVILIIKIIKIKIFWLLPLLVGVGTAKKLVLKFLLFLFPALGHVFKLCGYYQANYQKTNYHHHKHHINHLHTVLYDDDHHHSGSGVSAHGLDYVKNYIKSKPPTGHISEFIHGAPVPPHLSYQPSPSDDDWALSGPSLGSEFISDRSSNEVYRPKLDGTINKGHYPPSSHNTNPLTHFKNRSPSTYYKRRTYGPPRLPGTAAAASQIHPQYVNSPIDENLIKAQRQEALRIQKEQQLIAKQQSILNSQPFVSDVEPLTPKPIDPFYSPILSKLDHIFHQMGYNDEPCKERMVCNMYKEPTKYSPNSNYVSSELSRDSSELQRPTSSNPAVYRFYKYVQAARDGQDQKECALLYPCNLPTKK